MSRSWTVSHAIVRTADMVKPLALFPAAMLILASCTTLPADNSGLGNDAVYRALGTEPFWALEIADGAMTFKRAGEADIRVDAFDSRPSFNGWRHISPRIVVDVTFSQCSDGMSDNIHKDTVSISVDGAEFKGCGGGIIRHNP